MRNATTLSVAMLAAAIGFTLAPALRAQEAPGSAARQTPGMSNHGHMMGNDMRGMMTMMDECSRMMQASNERRGSPSPRSTSRNAFATKVAHTACCYDRVRTCGPQFSASGRCELRKVGRHE